MATATTREELQPRITKWVSILEDAAEASLYYDKIQKMVDTDDVRLIVDVNEIRSREASLAKQILEEPLLEVSAAQHALKTLVDGMDSTYSSKNANFFVGFEGSFGGHHVTPRGLSARLLGKMVCVEGIVSKCSLIRPKVVKSVHYCPKTEKTHERMYRDATSIDGMPTYGLYPREDETGNPLVTEFGLSIYKNHQRITVQEMPERAPTGQLPRSIEVILDNDLVDKVKPGDRIQLFGIYRALPSKRNGTTSGVFRTALLANNIKTLGRELLMPKLTETDIKNITKLAKMKRRKGQSPFTLLARSLAPSIYGNDQIKMGLLCLLLGGMEKNLNHGGHIRGDINVLMVGDPSCGKSQMLRFIQNTAPHCITTTGRGSSGVGLTAAVTTDQDTGDRRLEAGAMVLADRGIVCIDEFDKMSDIDRVSMHEVMEQQTVTIAKAGIHTTLNARCSVLAAANPVYGQYNPFATPTENIGLPDSLLSRFDLLFVMLDKMDPELDNNLAAHVLQSHLYRRPGEADGEAVHVETSADVIVAEADDGVADDDGEMYAKPRPGTVGSRRRRKILNVQFVKKYILYAKARCHPVLTPEAATFIAENYAALRSKETDTRTLPVTARTLETMIRLATAHAKSRLSPKVEVEDSHVAMDLINFAYYNDAEPLPKPRKRRDDDSSSDEDEDGDGDDGDGDGAVASASGEGDGDTATPSTPSSSGRKKKEKGASTPQSSQKGQRSGKRAARQRGDSQDGADGEVGDAAAADSPRTFSRRSQKKKAQDGVGSAAADEAEYDPYDFEGSSGPSPKKSKSKSKAAPSATSSKSPLKGKATKSTDMVQGDDEDEDDQDQGEKVGAASASAELQEDDGSSGIVHAERAMPSFSVEEMTPFRVAVQKTFAAEHRSTMTVEELCPLLRASGVTDSEEIVKQKLRVMQESNNDVYMSDNTIFLV
eukprot:m.360245 g.360245  ORF g.360245 m.360245 type:complete len:939 (-) comp18941_c0_seq1:97-2913(-)